MMSRSGFAGAAEDAVIRAGDGGDAGEALLPTRLAQSVSMITCFEHLMPHIINQQSYLELPSPCLIIQGSVVELLLRLHYLESQY